MRDEFRADLQIVSQLLVDMAEGGSTSTVDASRLRLRRWNNDQRVFEPAEWTDDLAAMRPSLAEHLGEMHVMRAGRRSVRGAHGHRGDDHTLVAPVTLFDSGRPKPPAHRCWASPW
jgi:hypothetical protein